MVVTDKRILVVDDEEIVRDSCKRTLTEAGYDVRTVESGHDALKACRAEKFDVMLTDLKMPDMDGIEVIRSVTKEFPELRVVVITGYPSHDTANQAASLGISDYLEKPLSPQRLSEATAAALTRAPRHTATVFPSMATDAAEPCESAQTETKELAESMPRRATSNRTRLAVLIALGFLAGVTVAYVISPGYALAWLALGTAVASGTVVGLLSDSASGERGVSESEWQEAKEAFRESRKASC